MCCDCYETLMAENNFSFAFVYVTKLPAPHPAAQTTEVQFNLTLFKHAPAIPTIVNKLKYTNKTHPSSYVWSQSKRLRVSLC